MIETLGPVSVGMVVGWMLYYFMRKYRLFSPKTLTATLAALAGGPVLTSLERWAAGGDAKLGLWYFFGVGLGFFAYAIYVGALSLLFVFGKIESPKRFEVAARCGIDVDEDWDRVERFAEFARVMDKWGNGELDEGALKIMLPALEFNRTDYLRLKYDSDPVVEMNAELLQRFENQGYVKYLRNRSPS